MGMDGLIHGLLAFRLVNEAGEECMQGALASSGLPT